VAVSDVHQRDPNQAPDSAFEPGGLQHLVVGNMGRMLDPRRTPVRIVALHLDRGAWELELLAFEEAGGHWELPCAQIAHFQFALGSPCASADVVAAAEAAIARFAVSLEVEASADARAETERRITVARARCGGWMDAHARFAPADLDLTGRTGHPRLYEDVRAWLATEGLDAMDAAFATRFVSNPGSGELIKGHRIVLAELGLVPFVGRVVRDAALFDGAWSREERARHIVARLAFVRELLERAGLPELVLWRGLATDRLRPVTNRTFVSSTPSREVAEAFCIGGRTAVLTRHTVPAERVFMTYLETREMNLHYQETEVVLLFAEGEPI